MSMIDPTEDQGDMVLATKSPTESPANGEADTAATSQGEPAPLVEVQLSQQHEGKLSPTAKYATDRYRLARPFTSLH